MIVHKLWIPYVICLPLKIYDKCQMSSGPYGPILIFPSTYGSGQLQVLKMWQIFVILSHVSTRSHFVHI